MTINRKIFIILSIITLFSLFNVFWLLNQDKSGNKQDTVKVGDLKDLVKAVDYLKTKEPFEAQNILQEESTNEATPESRLKQE